MVRGRACGSYRLQKSTGGAWPFTPEDEESSDHDDGSSPSARERRRGERASEAGSSVAKPRDRWRVPSKPVEPREWVGLGAPVEGRRFGSGKSSSLTRGRRKRSWLLESVRGLPRALAGRDRERQRSDVSLVHGRKSQAEVAPSEGGARHPPSRKARRAVHGSAEAGGAPSSARPAGAGSPQGGPASHGRTRPSGRGRILRSAQRKLRTRKSSGPRVLVSRVGCRGR